MDKTLAQQTITELFTQSFDPERYALFLRNLLNNYERRENRYYKNARLWDKFWPHINYYERIGKYTDPDGQRLDLLVVEVPSFDKLERARTTLRNLVVKHLKTFGDKDYALVAFYAKEDKGADWRFSFVKIEHQAWQDKKGKVKLKQELTPARRYSYLVGMHENSHTASKQLLPLLEMDYADPRIEEIEAAFSIEKVTDEFFDQYKALFQKLAEHLKKQPFFKQGSEEERDREVSRFAKKLLGQIVFLYFLQKKGWLGVPKGGKWGEGSKRFMRVRFEQVSRNGGNYYRDFLQYLFYEALADERKGQKDPGYYKRFDCRVPFLNGGLFEADYDWQNVTLDLPNTLFHNDEKTKSGDRGTGILDVFDRYNFTVKEDEPLEKEVAVDPEMLGKVFENMLEVTERKNKGAFYTPREIVHYMCQESLIHYLDNKLNSYASEPDLAEPQGDVFGSASGQTSLGEGNIRVPKEDIETLIRKGHLALENDTRVLKAGKETRDYRFQLPESVRQHAGAIDDALATIKVCDPAIGSGAFPVGLMHEIVNTRLALAPHSGNTLSAYELKRHVIAENHYGVDIDPSAIDIARLRLWLSLIVDEDDFDTIEALPNLDYRIVCGDSLIGFPENWNSPAFQKIEQLKKRFFAETDHKKKAKLKQQIDTEIQQRLDDSKQTFGYEVSFDFRLMFSEVWHENGGFDVVIGNPPYVQIQNFSGQQIQKDWERQRYESFAKRGDIYCLFYEQGWRLLRDHGVLAYITSNKWMRAAYGKKLRKFFLAKADIGQLIDFGDSPIFSEATTYTNILLFGKGKPQNAPTVWDLSTDYRKATSLYRMLEENSPGAPLFTEEGFVIASPEMAAIKKRIEQVGAPLRDWDIAINYGIKTGFNEAFIIDGKKKDELIDADPKSAEIIKPVLRGRDIKRYRVDFADLWLIVVKFGAYKSLPRDYPTIYRHLTQYEDKLKNRGQCRYTSSGKLKNGDYPGQHHWLELDNNPKDEYLDEFSKDKIVYAEIVFDSAFYFDTSGIYTEATAFVLTGEHTNYLTALLNSELLTFVFRAFYAGGDLRGDTFRYKKVFLQNLPVIKPEQPSEEMLEGLVNYVQFLITHEQKLHSAYFEQLIDALVYELYFPEEMQAAGKDVLRHLGELMPIIDEQSDEEKLAIIQCEFDRLYDPRHPVRNIIETLDSVEVVRTIREALKR